MVSIIVPVYNMDKYLPKCLDTLLHQNADQSQMEIILIDDGSTDQSSELCDNYASKYPGEVRVVHKKNGGLSSARNEGIDAAKGQYIVFPDPDDWVESDYVSVMLNLQEKYQPDLVCIGHYVDSDGKKTAANADCNENIIMNAKEAEKALFFPPSIGGFAWNKLYHLDVIREYKLRFLDDVGTTEDLDFAFRYLEHCDRVCFAPQYHLYHYCQRNGAATHSRFSRRQLEAAHTYQKILAVSSDPAIQMAAKEEICNIAVNMTWLYKESHVDDEKSWRTIRLYLSEYMGDYLKSDRYGSGRKVQALLARYMPDIYALLKNRITHR